MNISGFFNHHRAALRWIPALCFAIMIFALSATPGEEIGQSYERLALRLQMITATSNLQTVSPTTPPGEAASPAEAPFQRLPALPPFPKLDWLKVGHGFGYFWLGLTVLYALPTRWRWSPGLALLLCSLYAGTDEVHQLFVPGRSASARDIWIDTLAALGGVAVMLGTMALHSKRGSKK